MLPPDPRAFALALAGRHPEAVIACPACDAGVKGRNLSRHLTDTHADFTPALRWKNTGWWPGELRLEGRRLVLKRFLLGPRTVELPCAVGVASARVTRADVIDVSVGVPSPATHEESAGLCLVLPAGKPTIFVRCKTGGGVRKHWRGWTRSPAERGWNVTLAAGDFASLQHVLAAFGALSPTG